MAAKVSLKGQVLNVVPSEIVLWANRLNCLSCKGDGGHASAEASVASMIIWNPRGFGILLGGPSQHFNCLDRGLRIKQATSQAYQTSLNSRFLSARDTLG